GSQAKGNLVGIEVDDALNGLVVAVFHPTGLTAEFGIAPVSGEFLLPCFYRVGVAAAVGVEGRCKITLIDIELGGAAIAEPLLCSQLRAAIRFEFTFGARAGPCQ